MNEQFLGNKMLLLVQQGSSLIQFILVRATILFLVAKKVNQKCNSTWLSSPLPVSRTLSILNES